MDDIAFLKTLGVMVIGATALILLLRRLRLPAIVLCIAAGLLIGPLLGLVSFGDSASEPVAAEASGVQGEEGTATPSTAKRSPIWAARSNQAKP